MIKSLLTGVALAVLAFSPASADVILDTTGQGGTGNNVIFTSVASTNLILGRLNGQNDEVVRFRDLSGNGGFSGAANGNDIKIINTSDLDITIFDKDNLAQLAVTREIFSVKGDGQLFFHVTMLEADNTFKNFNFGGFDLKNGQNGFDFQATNGERIWDLDLVNIGGTITDFEHYRIDVQAVPGPVAGVPEPSTWAMLLIGFGFVSLYRSRRARREGREFRWLPDFSPPRTA